MKRTTLLIITLFLTANFLFAQNKFTNGFNTGYKKGYCQDQGVGCIDPIPPIAPIPKVGESSDSYTDGYNRGFQMGLSARKSNNSSNSSTTTNRTRYKTAKPKFVDFASGGYSNTDITNLKIKAITTISKRATENISNGNYDSAIGDANSLLKIQPNFALAYQIKSVAYYHKDRIIDAYNMSVKCDRIMGKKSEWREDMFNELTEYYKNMMSSNQYSNVIYTSESIWTPNNLTNYFHGLGYYFKGDYKKAKKYLKKVKDFEPAEQYLESIKNKNYYKNPYSGQKQETKPLNKSGNSKPNVDLQAIYKLLQNGKYKEGIALIDKSIGNEGNELLYGLRGTANYLSRNYSEAISDITKSAKTNKEILPDFLFYRAMAKSEVGDFYGAISDYDLLITKGDPKGQNYDLATVYNNKAYSYVGLKQFEKAIPFVTKALELDKGKWYIWDTRAEIYYNTGEYGKAINDATKAIKIQENANTLYIKGLSHIKLNEKELGCKDLSRAGELGKSEAYTEIKRYCN
ncbi:tetratricopeptide repeat protein [Gelatiniphilus marinus]|uniref:Tetratricopeptide repeat protein n=1 Tax=Gelatiniphilus marinus TaxID=1759464 RepID=A0ABW5JQP1_9FLAO